MTWFLPLTVFVALALGIALVASGQQAPPPCEETLNNEMFQAGALKQQLAVAQERLRVMTKERDDLKAKAAEKK